MQYMFNFLKKLCEKKNKNVDQHIVGYKTRQTITLIKKIGIIFGIAFGRFLGHAISVFKFLVKIIGS